MAVTEGRTTAGVVQGIQVDAAGIQAVNFTAGVTTSTSDGIANTGTQRVAVATPSTPITASSGNVAAGIATATLAANATKTTYITGFQVSAGGATVGAVVTGTITGLVTGTLSFTFAAPTGATVGATPLVVPFPVPVAGSAINTAIVVSMPSLGAGNTNTTVSAQGFQI